MKPRHNLLEKKWLSLALVFAIGAGLRFVHLAEVPRGYFHDEAWSAVKGWSIVSGAAAPQVYFAENNGMDAAHVYGTAALFAITGPLAIGSRLVSSLMGSLSILATYWAARELFERERHRHALSLIAAFVVATLFWALTTSRSAWHVPWMTLAITLSLAALFRGRRLMRRRWYLVAGLLAGLAQYTYPSARFLPPLLALIVVFDLWTHRAPHWRKVLSDYLFLFAAAAIVFAPLGVYFIHNPELFFVRAQQTADAATSDLAGNILKTLAGFSTAGDTEGLHNLDSRPALDPILTVFFLIGLIRCAGGRRSPHGILIVWLIAFSLPVVLTGQAPLFRRWTGILAAEGMIIALGVIGVVEYAHMRLSAPIVRSLARAALASALGFSAVWSAADYFGPYTSAPYMFWAYDSGMTQVADYIQTRPDATVFLTPYDRFYEVVDITLAEARRSPPIQSYNGAGCAVFPEVTTRQTEWVVIVEKDEQTLPLMQRLFPAGQIVWQIDSPVGPYARAFHVPAGESAKLELVHRDHADFGNKVQLIGYDLSSPIAAGEMLRLTLALKAIAPLDRAYKVFVHLRGAGDAVIAQADQLPCDFSLNEADWRPGDVVLEEYALPIPYETEPGTYRVILGLYQPDINARLPVLSSALAHTDDGVSLGEVEVK